MERHELETKAEELFNMTFAALAWDEQEEAEKIVTRAVKDGIMETPDESDMRDYPDQCAEEAQDRMRDAIRENILSIDKTIVETYTLATGGPAYGVEVRYNDYDGDKDVDAVRFWYQDWFTEKAYYDVPEHMQDIVLDALGIEY